MSISAIVTLSGYEERQPDETRPCGKMNNNTYYALRITYSVEGARAGATTPQCHAGAATQAVSHTQSGRPSVELAVMRNTKLNGNPASRPTNRSFSYSLPPADKPQKKSFNGDAWGRQTPQSTRKLARPHGAAVAFAPSYKEVPSAYQPEHCGV